MSDVLDLPQCSESFIRGFSDILLLDYVDGRPTDFWRYLNVLADVLIALSCSRDMAGVGGCVTVGERMAGYTGLKRLFAAEFLPVLSSHRSCVLNGMFLEVYTRARFDLACLNIRD